MDAAHAWAPGAAAHLHALKTLHAVSTRVHASLDLAETLDAVARGVVEAAGFELAAVNLLRPDGDFEVVAVAGHEEARGQLMGTTATRADWDELLTRAQRQGSLYFVDHAAETPAGMTDWVPDLAAPAEPGGWHPLDSLFAPLTTPEGEWVGVLSVDAPVGGRRPGPQQREVLELFAEHAAIAVLHARMHAAVLSSRAQLEHQASHDALTGLPNRARVRAWVDGLGRTPGVDAGVLVVDLDGFKLVNDTAGHEAGDAVLRAVAERMSRCVREGDLLARTGGDEFLVLLSGPDVGAVLPALADRLRRAVAQPVESPFGTHAVGASIGAATGRTPLDFTALVARADAEMYAVKQETHRRTGQARRSG